MGRLRHRVHAYWRALRRGAELDRELAREIEAHIEDQTEDNISRGMPLDEARRAARRQFGPRASVEEECREARGVSLIEQVTRDMRYAWRGLVHQPMLIVAATTSIGLGVGANLTVYALANDLLLSVPSAHRPDELVHVRTGNGTHVSYAAWRAMNESGAVAGMAGYRIGSEVNLQRGDLAMTVTPLVVTPNFFDVVGVPLARGRGFRPSDVGDEHLVVVTQGVVRRHLADLPEAIGATLRLNGAPHTVIGVLAADLRSLPGYGVAPDIYLLASRSVLPPIEDPTVPVVQLVGRLHESQSAEQARDALAATAVRFGESVGDREIGALMAVTRVGSLGQIKEFEAIGAFFLVLFVVSLLVLSIGCANVAGLLLARSLSRSREIAMRLALGASRRRLLQQLMTESLLLAFIGSLAGFGLTWLVGLVLAEVHLPLPIPLKIQPVFDLRLLLASGALVVMATILCGLLPAVQATKAVLLPSIREAPAFAGRRFTVRRLLVIGQVTMSALLLAVALLFVRNLQRSASVDPGFDVSRVVAAEMTFVEGRQGSPSARTIAEVVRRIRQLPNVT